MNNLPQTTRAGWQPLPHEHLPRPTYFPAGLAMGTTFLFWGLITSWVIFLVGLVSEQISALRFEGRRS